MVPADRFPIEGTSMEFVVMDRSGELLVLTPLFLKIFKDGMFQTLLTPHAFIVDLNDNQASRVHTMSYLFGLGLESLGDL